MPLSESTVSDIPHDQLEQDEDLATDETEPEVVDDRDAWAEAAREVLIAVAGRYHRVTTYKDLATKVQASTGITTKRQAHLWIGDVLNRVSVDGVERGEPLLASLCVNAAGQVSGAYADAVSAIGGTVEGDADDHAAEARLACYQYFKAENLPESGGVSALTPRLTAARERAWKAKPIQRVIDFCPKCYMEIPPTGECDNCA